MLDSILGAAVQGAAQGMAEGLGTASTLAQGNKPMVNHLRSQAIPRIGVWLALAVWALVRAKNLITGESRGFRDLTLSGATHAAGVAIAVGAAALCVLAAWRTYVVERKPPSEGTLWFPGYRLPLFGEWLLAIIGGLLLLVAIWSFTTIPESIAAGQSERYRHYHSASPTPALVIGALMGGLGFLCMIMRRSRWDLVPGQPLVRRMITAFSRPRSRGDEVSLVWEDYWIGTGVTRRQVAWVLRARIANKNAFEISFAPLTARIDHRARLAYMWRQRLEQNGVRVTSIDAGPDNK